MPKRKDKPECKCGETDPDKFSPTNFSRCHECCNEARRQTYAQKEVIEDRSIAVANLFLSKPVIKG